MTSGVTVVRQALSDTRYKVLAYVCGLADEDHAIGKMVRLWNQCLEGQTYVLTVDDVVAVLGANAIDGLRRSRLGEEVDGGVRLRGTEGRIEWLGEKRQQSSAAGRARAATAERGPDGRLLPRRVASGASGTPAVAGVAGPTVSSGHPADSSPSSSSSSSSSQITHTGDVVASLSARARTKVWNAATPLASQIGVTYQHGNPMQVEPLIRYAVAAWLAEGGEDLVWDRIDRLIGFRSKRALTEKHLRFWTETTWWNWDGIGKDLGQPMDLPARDSKGRGTSPARGQATASVIQRPDGEQPL